MSNTHAKGLADKGSFALQSETTQQGILHVY